MDFSIRLMLLKIPWATQNQLAGHIWPTGLMFDTRGLALIDSFDSHDWYSSNIGQNLRFEHRKKNNHNVSFVPRTTVLEELVGNLAVILAAALTLKYLSS